MPTPTLYATVDMKYKRRLYVEAVRGALSLPPLKTKYLAMLYYGLGACPISKRQHRSKSLNYVLRSSFRKKFKIFKTKSQDNVNEGMLCLTVLLPRK